MKYIVSFSGGKDSTAMLLRLIEEKKPIDEIIFCDTGKEFPDLFADAIRLDRLSPYQFSPKETLEQKVKRWHEKESPLLFGEEE